MNQALRPLQRRTAPIPAAPATAPRTFTVGVRAKLGEELEGLEAHIDGISFRSPRPIEGGELLELTICRVLQVDARVIGCAPLTGSEGGYWIRTVFEGVSPALNAILTEELARLTAAALR